MDIIVDRDEVLRYLGYSDSEAVTEDVMALLNECESKVLSVATPRMIFSPELPINRISGLNIENMPLLGNDIASHLERSDSAILMAVTLGIAVDRLIARENIVDTAGAVCMDAIANVAIEYVADVCEAEIRASLVGRGRYATGRYSPGYGDMPLASQRDLLRILDAERRIGLTLTATNLMVPKKSITAVLGVASEPVSGKRAGCATCALRGECVYRRRGTTCDR